MKSDNLKISIITPSFNSGKYIEQAIQSVVAQEYSNFEHIIVDGGSTDGTIEILRKYPRLKWVSEPDNGQSHAMNKGFEMSTGEIIVYLNADDFFEPEAFKTIVEHLDKDGGVYVIAGEVNVIDDFGNIKTTENSKVTLFEMLHWWKPNPYPCNPVSYFYYREVQSSIGGFDENKNLNMDYDFLLKVASKYKIGKIDNMLGNFRFIKGTKTYQTQGFEYIHIKNDFTKDFWNHLNKIDRLRLYVSYFFRKIDEFIYFSVKYIKSIYRLSHEKWKRTKNQ